MHILLKYLIFIYGSNYTIRIKNVGKYIYLKIYLYLLIKHYIVFNFIIARCIFSEYYNNRISRILSSFVNNIKQSYASFMDAIFPVRELHTKRRYEYIHDMNDVNTPLHIGDLISI